MSASAQKRWWSPLVSKSTKLAQENVGAITPKDRLKRRNLRTQLSDLAVNEWFPYGSSLVGFSDYGRDEACGVSRLGVGKQRLGFSKHSA
jgi:hypothetical protein